MIKMMIIIKCLAHWSAEYGTLEKKLEYLLESRREEAHK
jgi:hypothetical protein